MRVCGSRRSKGGKIGSCFQSWKISSVKVSNNRFFTSKGVRVFKFPSKRGRALSKRETELLDLIINC